MKAKSIITYNSTGFWCLLAAISLGIHGAIALFLLQKIVRLEIVPPTDWVAVDMVGLPTGTPTGTKPFTQQSTQQSAQPEVSQTVEPTTEPTTETTTTPDNNTEPDQNPEPDQNTEAIAPNSPQPTPPPEKSPIPSPTSPTPTNNPKPTPAPSPTRSPTPTNNPKPSPTPSPKPSPSPVPSPSPSPSPAPPANNGGGNDGGNGGEAIATGLTVKFGNFELSDPNRDIPDQIAKPKKNQQQLTAVDYLLPLNLNLSSNLSLIVTLGIDEQGKVDEIYTVTVQKGELNPTEAKALAQRILSKWLFEPSLMGGQPVFQSYRVILNIEPNF